VLQHRMTEARTVMAKLLPEQEISKQIEEIQATVKEKPEPVLKRLRSLFQPSLKLALTIGIMIAIVQQITGINAIYFYAPSIFEQSGVGTDAAFAQAVLVGVVNVIFTLLAMLLIDRIGRKPLLLIGLTGIMVSMLLCSYGFNNASYQLTNTAAQEIVLNDDSGELNLESLQGLVDKTFTSDVEFKQAANKALGERVARSQQSVLIKASINIDPYVVLIGILGFVASFALSLGPVMWVLLPEIFPNNLRGVAMAVTGMINSLSSFIVQFVFPWELNTLGAASTFAIYGGFAAVSLVLVFWMLPETRGKSLEELEIELRGRTA